MIPLDDWTQNSISAIYQAKTDSEFSSAFDAFIHEEASITVNGKHLSRAQYKALFQGERLLEQSARVSFLGSVEVPANKDEPVAVSTYILRRIVLVLTSSQAGSVGIFYKVIVDEKIKVLGADRSTTVNSSLNVV